MYEVEDSYNTGAQEYLELADPKIKGKLKSKDLQPNMHLKDESENMSEAEQYTEEKELQPEYGPNIETQ